MATKKKSKAKAKPAKKAKVHHEHKKDYWVVSFDNFSYRNSVIKYNLIGITIFAIGMFLGLFMINRLTIKISGYVAAAFMIYGLLLSIKNTKVTRGEAYTVYFISDVVLAILIAIFATFITML